jgi:hypothetical protein
VQASARPPPSSNVPRARIAAIVRSMGDGA